MNIVGKTMNIVGKTMIIVGKTIQRTRLVRTDRLVIAVVVEATIPDANSGEPCNDPATVELLREVDAHAKAGDIEWLKLRGKDYGSIDTAA